MDLFRTLFSGSCDPSQQSLLDQALTGPPEQGYSQQDPEPFEDAWEESELRQQTAPDFAAIWAENSVPELLLAPPQLTNSFEGFTEFWQSLCQIEEDEPFEYFSQRDNPYLSAPLSYEQCLELSRQGDVNNAILALEVSVTLNPENSDNWRLLGQLNTENDEDKRAIAALVQGHSSDPYNLDILLALGVGLINESSQLALDYLKL